MERNYESRNRSDNDRNRRQGNEDNGRNENLFSPGHNYGNDRSESGLRSGSVSYRDTNWDANTNDYNDYRNRGSYNQESHNQDYGHGNHYGSSYGNRYGDQRYNQNRSRDWWDKTKDEVSGWLGDENAQYRRERDHQSEHRGKGPKGYTRSDERIKEDVNERLTDDGYIDAGEIEIDVKNGEVFLKGTVRTRQEKRRTEDIIESISGVKNVENHLKVEEYRSNTGKSQYSSGLREGKSGLEYGSDAVSGLATSSSTGDFSNSKK